MVSACEKKPTGQTVAVVNNEEITAADLNAALTSNNVNAANATKDVRNQALSQLIDRRLLTQQAKADGLDKTPDFLNQQRVATENLLINLLVSRQANTQQAPTASDISAYEASHPGMFAKHEVWTLETLVYPPVKDAAVTAKIAAAKTLEELAQTLVAANIQYKRATRQLDTATLPPQIYNQLNNVAPSEPFVVPGPENDVASVITDRKAAPLSADQQQQLAVAAIRREKVQGFVNQRLKDLKAKAKIEYGAGFGPPKTATK